MIEDSKANFEARVQGDIEEQKSDINKWKLFGYTVLTWLAFSFIASLYLDMNNIDRPEDPILMIDAQGVIWSWMSLIMGIVMYSRLKRKVELMWGVGVFILALLPIIGMFIGIGYFAWSYYKLERKRIEMRVKVEGGMNIDAANKCDAVPNESEGTKIKYNMSPSHRFFDMVFRYNHTGPANIFLGLIFAIPTLLSYSFFTGNEIRNNNKFLVIFSGLPAFWITRKLYWRHRRGQILAHVNAGEDIEDHILSAWSRNLILHDELEQYQKLDDCRYGLSVY